MSPVVEFRPDEAAKLGEITRRVYADASGDTEYGHVYHVDGRYLLRFIAKLDATIADLRQTVTRWGEVNQQFGKERTAADARLAQLDGFVAALEADRAFVNRIAKWLINAPAVDIVDLPPSLVKILRQLPQPRVGT